MDVLAVREAVAEHIHMAREERQPTLVEAFTYRYRGHSAADPEVYRSKRRSRSGARRTRSRSSRDRLLEAEGDLRGERRGAPGAAERQVMDAVAFADNSPEPPLESLYDHLYVVGDQVPGWYAVDERTPEPHRGEQEREVEPGARRGACRGGSRIRRAGKPQAAAPDRRAGATRR